MARTGRTWAKITERIGLLLLLAVVTILGWLLALRAFRLLLDMLN